MAGQEDRGRTLRIPRQKTQEGEKQTHHARKGIRSRLEAAKEEAYSRVRVALEPTPTLQLSLG